MKKQSKEIIKEWIELTLCDMVDEIKYWVLKNSEVKKNKYLSHQHRGGVEYQIGITNKNISEFEIYRKNPDEICVIFHAGYFVR